MTKINKTNSLTRLAEFYHLVTDAEANSCDSQQNVDISLESSETLTDRLEHISSLCSPRSPVVEQGVPGSIIEPLVESPVNPGSKTLVRCDGVDDWRSGPFEQSLGGKIRLASLNCKNIKANYIYINNLLEKNDIVFLQETWLKEDETLESELNSDFRFFQKSGMDGQQNRGRPYGGVMWLIKKSFTCPRVKFFSPRISTIEFPGTVIVGVYLRFNDNKPETTIDQMSDLAEVEDIIDKAKDKNVVIIGDFNMDIYRNKKYDKLLTKFVEKNKLISGDLMYTQATNYTYKSGKNRSWVDHVLVNSSIADKILQVNLLSYDNEKSNTSDHIAIEIEFDSTHTHKKLSTNKRKANKLDWNILEIRKAYETNLNKLLLTLNPSNLISSNESNVVASLDEFINEFNSKMRASAELTKQSNQKKNKHIKRKKWWDSEMQYIHEQMRLAYIDYKSSNFSDEKRKNYSLLRNHFRFKQREKIRKNKKNYQRKLEMLYRYNKSDFWKSLKKTKKRLPEVNIQTGQLKSSFSNLFNTKLVNDEQNINEIENKSSEIKQKLQTITNSDFEINKTSLEIIIKGLKNNKSVGFSEVSNEMYKYGGETALLCVKLILEKIFQFGKMPHLFNIVKILPIIKEENEDNGDINNIRPITISDTMSNIFEKVIINDIENNHLDQNLQFGFKRNSSTNHAIFVLKETVNFYNYKKKNVYACAIDASKAFDKINRILLAHKMMNKVAPQIWRALVNYYATSIAYVLNNGEMSEVFKTTIGVKQGGPLSPRLFAIYVEDLIIELENCTFGTTLDTTKTGVLMFADDLIVLSDSKDNLQKMLKIIEMYCLKNEIKINAKKTQYIRFGNFDCANESLSITLDGHKIKKVEKIEYLGVWLDSKLKSHTQIDEKKVSINNAFNALRKVGIADKETSVNVKTFLYKVYCRPVLLYGIENLTLQKKDVKNIQTIEGTLIKYSYSLSKTTRTTNLLNAVEIDQSSNRIQLIKLKFFLRLLNNDTTRNILEVIISAFARSKEQAVIKNSLIRDILECGIEEAVLIDTTNRKKIIKEKVKTLKKKHTDEGISDSIRTCLNNRSNQNNEKILKLLVQSFEKKNTRTCSRNA